MVSRPCQLWGPGQGCAEEAGGRSLAPRGFAALPQPRSGRQERGGGGERSGAGGGGGTGESAAAAAGLGSGHGPPGAPTPGTEPRSEPPSAAPPGEVGRVPPADAGPGQRFRRPRVGSPAGEGAAGTGPAGGGPGPKAGACGSGAGAGNVPPAASRFPRARVGGCAAALEAAGQTGARGSGERSLREREPRSTDGTARGWTNDPGLAWVPQGRHSLAGLAVSGGRRPQRGKVRLPGRRRPRREKARPRRWAAPAPQGAAPALRPPRKLPSCPAARKRKRGGAGAGGGQMAECGPQPPGGGSGAAGAPSRHEKSLGLLTTKFVSLLQEAKDGVLDLKLVRGLPAGARRAPWGERRPVRRGLERVGVWGGSREPAGRGRCRGSGGAAGICRPKAAASLPAALPVRPGPAAFPGAEEAPDLVRPSCASAAALFGPRVPFLPFWVTGAGVIQPCRDGGSMRYPPARSRKGSLARAVSAKGSP